jgi:predicted MFS family arabinose efflux permease
MRATARPSTFAPFRIRAFRFQWPADLATSWAFEMETLILGWYVLVETRSVLLLTFFVSLQHLGTLISPMFGVMADRLGHRNVLCAMRGFYALLATTLMTFTFLGVLTPLHVFLLAGLMGLVRPSDVGMRAALVGDTMPPTLLVGAMGVQRTTIDSAKIIGALTGAGLVTALGMAPAYLVVASFYATSVLLTLKAGSVRRLEAADKGTPPKVRASPWRDLKEGMAYVWTTPHLLALMLLAFLLNLTAFPVFNGLLPYVAKEIYATDQRGLGFMVAGAAFGALVGSLTMSRHGRTFRPGHLMVLGSLGWFAFLLIFANVSDHLTGIGILFLAGLVQSVSQVPMTAMLLRTSHEQYRGRVMGIRMLAIYGNVPGLLLAGQLIPRIGYPMTASLYCLAGIVFTLWIALTWRRDVWRRDAPANAG